jgi:uncharacterized protein involved in tolerance to divalent cations
MFMKTNQRIMTEDVQHVEAFSDYVAPRIEVIQVNVERGFQLSGTVDAEDGTWVTNSQQG